MTNTRTFILDQVQKIAKITTEQIDPLEISIVVALRERYPRLSADSARDYALDIAYNGMHYTTLKYLDDVYEVSKDS